MSKAYFFNAGQYSRYDINRDSVDSAYPLPVSGNWRGLPTTGIDAAINWGNGYAYFFASSQYYRFNIKMDQVDSGFPLQISGNWKGLNLDAVDACVNWGDGKAYFFRGAQYWRYDIKNDSVDSGYPLPISGKWPGLNLDAVDGCINWGNGKAYFFRRNQYWRYDIKKDAVDPGFPLPITGNWQGLFSSSVRAPIELGYAGFDRLDYPGDALMTALWNQTNLSWSGFYLAPAPSQGRGTSWMTKRAFLANMGWGLAPIYVGEQQRKGAEWCTGCSFHPSAAKGTQDAADAIGLATRAGFPAGSVIYLDLESWGAVESPLRDYYTSWTAGVIAGGWLPGVYCPHVLARQLRGFDSRPVFWVVNPARYRNGPQATYSTPLPTPEPLLSGIEFSTVWQLAMNVGSLNISSTLKLSTVDFDCASVPDPSWIS